jgi:hypothetical protein
MAGGGAALACVFLFDLPGRRRKWQSRLGSLALAGVTFGVAFVAGFGVTGCGGMTNSMMQPYSDSLNSSSATPNAAKVLAPGTYTVIVTGTASVLANAQVGTTVNVVHNIPLQVVVQ